MAGSATRRAARQAKLQASVRYAPQTQAINQTLSSLLSDLMLGVQQEHGIRGVLQASARKAIPTVHENYSKARSAADAAQAVLSGDLGKLGASAAPYAASAAVERAAGASRTAASEAQTSSELQSRINDAASGEAYAIRNLQGNYVNQRNKALDALQGVASQKGAYAAATTESILSQIRKDQIQLRGQSLAHKDRVRGQNLTHQDRQAAIAARAAAKGKGKGGGLTPDQRSKRVKQIHLAASWFQKLDGHFPRHQIYQALRTGQTATDPAGNKQKIPQIDNDFINAGADLHYLHYISNPNITALRRNHGFKVPKAWRRGSNFKIPRGTSVGTGR